MHEFTALRIAIFYVIILACDCESQPNIVFIDEFNVRTVVSLGLCLSALLQAKILGSIAIITLSCVREHLAGQIPMLLIPLILNAG